MNVVYIPVRGGSESIPLKNIKHIAGEPLVYWATKAACECTVVDKVFISTDSPEIRDVVLQFIFPNLEIINRSKESATNTASTEYGMLEFANQYEFSNIALVQATSPLITSDDLLKGFEALSKDEVDSVLSVVNQKRFIWDVGKDGYGTPVNYNYLERPRRQDFNGYLVENGAFYMTSRDALLHSKCRLSGNIKAVIMPPETYIELDEPEDWIIVEQLLLNRRMEHKTNAV